MYDDRSDHRERGRGPGSPDYRFERIGERLIQRKDREGDVRRFELFPEVREVLNRLKAAGKCISLASYNYIDPVLRALEAFGIRQYFQHPVAAWTVRKDLMIELILASFEQERVSQKRSNLECITPPQVLFVDDSVAYEKWARKVRDVSSEEFEEVGVEFWHLTESPMLLQVLSRVLGEDTWAE